MIHQYLVEYIKSKNMHLWIGMVRDWENRNMVW